MDDWIWIGATADWQTEIEDIDYALAIVIPRCPTSGPPAHLSVDKLSAPISQSQESCVVGPVVEYGKAALQPFNLAIRPVPPGIHEADPGIVGREVSHHVGRRCGLSEGGVRTGALK